MSIGIHGTSPIRVDEDSGAQKTHRLHQLAAGFANAVDVQNPQVLGARVWQFRGYPQTFATPWTSWKWILFQSALIGLVSGFGIPTNFLLRNLQAFAFVSDLCFCCQIVTLVCIPTIHLSFFITVWFNAMDTLQTHNPNLRSWAGARVCQCRGYPQTFAGPSMPWKPTLSQSTP